MVSLSPDVYALWDFGGGDHTFSTHNIQCTGSERNITDCTYALHGGTCNEAAGVKCLSGKLFCDEHSPVIMEYYLYRASTNSSK